jgi:hypothetical protein
LQKVIVAIRDLEGHIEAELREWVGRKKLEVVIRRV